MTGRTRTRGLGFLLSTVFSVLADGVARLLGVPQAYAYLGLIVAGFALAGGWLAWIVVDVLRASRRPEDPRRTDPRRDHLAQAAGQVEVLDAAE